MAAAETRTPETTKALAGREASMDAKLILAQDLPLAEIDILGAEDGSNFILGNAVLAELVGRITEGEKEQDASRLEDNQLGVLATPAGNLLQVAEKLAVAVRLGCWLLHPDQSTYDAALFHLLASTLSDVIVLRQAELRRRELLAEVKIESGESG
jgi:hypothetical protein